MISDETYSTIMTALSRADVDDETARRNARAQVELMNWRNEREAARTTLQTMIQANFDRALRFADEAMQSPQGITGVQWQTALHAFIRAFALAGASSEVATASARTEAMLSMIIKTEEK